MLRNPEDYPTAFCPRFNFSNIDASMLRIAQTTSFLLQSAFCLLLLLTTYHSALTKVYSQSATATLTGTVTDQNGAVVPDVSVKVINIDQGFERTTTTSDEGTFVVPLLPPGKYIVKAEHEGFTTYEARDVTLNVNGQVRLPIQLKVGGISNQTVDIVDTPPLIDESPAVGTVVDRAQVENMPLNGRSFQSLITLTPGVVLTTATSFNRGQFSVNGQRANANYFSVDGVSANIGGTTTDGISQDFAGSLPGLNTFGGTNSLVSVDALEEFKIQTSTFAPEFGRTPGGQVQILTRSGTNEFHGTLFEYFRNDAFDARDWFVNANRLVKPALRQNDFGFVFGGPVMLPRFGEGGPLVGYNGRNRTFFFLSYEGLRLRQPQTENRLVPSVRVRQTAALALQPILNALPIPTGPEIGTTGQAPYAASFSNPSSLNATGIRIDHVIGTKLALFGRYNYAPSKTITRNLSTLTTAALTPETLTLGATFTPSPRSSNEVRFNFSKVEGQNLQDLDSFRGAVPFAKSLLLPSFALNQRSGVTVSLGSFGTLGFGTFNDNFQSQTNIIDNLSYVAGEHQLKFGVDYRRLAPIYNPREYAQSAIFSTLNDILAARASFVILFAIKSSRPLFNNFSLYGQDTWRFTRRLTLTYGLRWDVNPPPSEANGNLPLALSGVDNKATMAFAPDGQPLYETTYNNFGPRVGISYQLSQRPGREITVRGGFGVFYDLGNGQTAESFTRYPFATTTPVVRTSLPSNATVGGSAATIQPATSVPCKRL